MTPLTSMQTCWDRITEDPVMKQELEKSSIEIFGKRNNSNNSKSSRVGWGEFWLTTPKDDRRLCLVSTERRGSVAPDVSMYVPERNDDGYKPVDVNRIHQKSKREEARREEEERHNPTATTSSSQDGQRKGMEKEEKGKGTTSVRLSGREIDDALQYMKMTTPIHAFVYPLLLVQPAEKEVLRGVEWTGARMCKQWIPSRKLKVIDEAWKLAHRYKIEGFESKKKWAAQETMGLDQEVAELEGTRVSPKKKSRAEKKWS